MSTLRTLSLVLPALLLSGCGLGLSAYAIDDTASVDEEDDDGGGGGNNGGGGNGGGGTDTGLGDGGGGNGGGEGDGGGDDGSQDDIAVTGLSPDFGTTAGGTLVEISGGPFDSSAEVYFGSTAGSVVSTTESLITVRTPAVSEEGLYSVTVRAAAGDGELESGFVFWTDGTGKNGTLGVIEFTEQVGSYWGAGGGSETFGSAAAYFVAPTDIEWFEVFAPTLDTCRNEASYTFNGTIEIYDPGVSSIQLSGSRSMNLSWDAEYGYYALAELTTSQWAANTSYDLQPMSGGGFPEVTVSGMAATAATPTLYSPSITGSTVVDISPNPTFSWAATGADWVLITLGIWDSGGTGYQEMINCVARDDGSFRVDTGQFSQWPYSRQIDVYFGPARKATGTLPWNNAQSGIVGLTRIYGAGFTWY